MCLILREPPSKDSTVPEKSSEEFMEKIDSEEVPSWIASFSEELVLELLALLFWVT